MSSLLHCLNFILVKISITLIYIYQACISPLLGSSCIYHPSCSHYAREALNRFGFIYGTFLCVKRILRCHPFEQGGYDPVPEKNK